jgi:hypothetical protein
LKNWIVIAFLSAVCVARAHSQGFSQAIEDNSFLIEEAYNQEDGVVQHIFNGYFDRGTKDLILTFTQEWPLDGRTHQVSFSVAYQSLGAGVRGPGDTYLNYRYQLWDEDKWCWIAPRLSLILPTGRASDGLGYGSMGVQLSLPLSKRWTEGFVSHLNLGATIVPRAEGMLDEGGSVRKTLQSYLVGASGIYLISEHFNLMCEVVYNYSSSINGDGTVEFSSETFLSPGIRYAINIGSLQIVPGAAALFSFTSSAPRMNVFAYLSFEHPF